MQCAHAHWMNAIIPCSTPIIPNSVFWYLFFSEYFQNNLPRTNSDSTDLICHVSRSVYSQTYSGWQLQSNQHSSHQCSNSDNTLASATFIQWTFMELQTTQCATYWGLETIRTLCVNISGCLWNSQNTWTLQTQLKSVHIHVYIEFAVDILLLTRQTLELLPQDPGHVPPDHNWEAGNERLKERDRWKR